MKIKEIIKLIKLHIKYKWNIEDYLMKCNLNTNEQHNPFDSSDNISYTCMRDTHGYAVYVPTDHLDMFLKSEFYNEEYNLINISALKKIRQRRNYSSDVYDNITPATVKLKFVDYIWIKDIYIYVIYSTDLDYNDDLYNDLVNYHKIEGRY